MTGPLIEWGVAARPLAGEDQSGDSYVIKTLGDKVLAAAIDGLGHGSEAAEAARIAAMTLTNHASEDIISLVKICHETLTKTRGVVLSVASIDLAKNTMTWLGVGNVVGLLMRADPAAVPSHESLMQRGGVVGYQMPSLRATTVEIKKRDTLIFTTDGIRSGFDRGVNRRSSPQRIADAVIANFNRKTDDALVLVVRYIGDTL